MPKLGRKKLGADLTIIIPAAGVGRRMKSHGAKPLIEISSTETVINRQINIFKKQYPKSEIIVVVGFQADKIIKHLPLGIKIIENELYEETNVVRSIGMALRIASNPNILIVYGDLVFNIATLNNLTSNNSAVIIDSHGQIDSEEVGLTIIDENVTYFSYNLDIKWGQIAFITGYELDLFKTIVCNKEKRKLHTFEIFNTIIEAGGRFKAIEPKYMKIKEIDSFKDIELARKIK